MKNPQKKIMALRKRRALRVRSALVATKERLRLSVHRTKKHINGQIIDLDGRVVVAVSDVHLHDDTLRGIDRAAATGKLIAERAKSKHISAVVFDKGRYKYHGRVKAFADGAREGGLNL